MRNTTADETSTSAANAIHKTLPFCPALMTFTHLRSYTLWNTPFFLIDYYIYVEFLPKYET
jgi:hypothetical protein